MVKGCLTVGRDVPLPDSLLTSTASSPPGAESSEKSPGHLWGREAPALSPGRSCRRAPVGLFTALQ